jgi:hypothetical protein
LAFLLEEAERMRAGSTMTLPTHAAKQYLPASMPLLTLDDIDASDVFDELPGDVKIEVKEEIT